MRARPLMSTAIDEAAGLALSSMRAPAGALRAGDRWRGHRHRHRGAWWRRRWSACATASRCCSASSAPTTSSPITSTASRTPPRPSSTRPAATAAEDAPTHRRGSANRSARSALELIVPAVDRPRASSPRGPAGTSRTRCWSKACHRTSTTSSARSFAMAVRFAEIEIARRGAGRGARRQRRTRPVRHGAARSGRPSCWAAIATTWSASWRRARAPSSARTATTA